MDERLRQRAIFGRLRRQRAEPFAKLVLGQRLVEPGFDVGLGPRHRVDFGGLGRIDLAVGERRGELEHRVAQIALAGLVDVALEEQVGGQAVLDAAFQRLLQLALDALAAGRAVFGVALAEA